MRTWHFEAALVALVLTVTVLVSHGGRVETLGAVAVFASFGHATVADRLAEREAARPVPAVHCYRWLAGYYVVKELAWLGYFVAHQSWSALVGVGVFLAYPLWRRWYRSRSPLQH